VLADVITGPLPNRWTRSVNALIDLAMWLAYGKDRVGMSAAASIFTKYRPFPREAAFLAGPRHAAYRSQMATRK